MLLITSAFALGLLFGLGLIISRMIDPAKVLAFLDVFGNWDPSLGFVMAGAVAASAVGFAFVKRRGAPILAPKLEIPSRRRLDLRLLTGAALFGVGWGLVGLCPGPALTILPLGLWQAFVFFVALLTGMVIFRLVPSDWPPATFRREPQGADA